jgi:GNAT superfamily N-acetyltransferase
MPDKENDYWENILACQFETQVKTGPKALRLCSKRGATGAKRPARVTIEFVSDEKRRSLKKALVRQILSSEKCEHWQPRWFNFIIRVYYPSPQAHQAIGFMLLDLSLEQAQEPEDALFEIYLDLVWVEPKFRSCGLSNAFMEGFSRWFLQTGIPKGRPPWKRCSIKMGAEVHSTEGLAVCNKLFHTLKNCCLGQDSIGEGYSTRTPSWRAHDFLYELYVKT